MESTDALRQQVQEEATKVPTPQGKGNENLVTPTDLSSRISKDAKSGSTPSEVDPHLVRLIMYALQGYDAQNSAKFFRERPGNHETTPLMKPFSHAGKMDAPMMDGGFALYDALRTMILKKLGGDKAATAGDMAQAASNIEGIKQTNNSRRLEQRGQQ